SPGLASDLTRASTGQWPPMSSSSSSRSSPRLSMSSSSSSSSSDQSTIGFSTQPIPSISQRARSPGRRKTGGSRKTPTPDGVPVAMMSPGSSVIDLLMNSMSSAMFQIM